MRRGKIYLVTLSREREKKEEGGAAGDLTHTYLYPDQNTSQSCQTET